MQRGGGMKHFPQRGQSNQEHIITPPPLYPPAPTPQPFTNELLNEIRSYKELQHYMINNYGVKKIEPSSAFMVEKFSDQYEATYVNEPNLAYKMDMARMPKELWDTVPKRKLKKSALSDSDVKAKLQKLVEAEDQVKPNEDEAMEVEAEGKSKEGVIVKEEVDEDEEKEVNDDEEGEEVDEELDEGNDYLADYFDNGEEYIESDEDGGDDGPVY